MPEITEFLVILPRVPDLYILKGVARNNYPCASRSEPVEQFCSWSGLQFFVLLGVMFFVILVLISFLGTQKTHLFPTLRALFLFGFPKYYRPVPAACRAVLFVGRPPFFVECFWLAQA